MTQVSLARALSDTGQMMSGALSPSASSSAIAEEPDLLAFFADLGRVAPVLVNEATPADLASLHRMGVACRLCGQFALAESFYARALELAQSAYGVAGIETATHRNFLAGLYFTCKRYRESVTLIETSLHVYQSNFGADHIYTRLTHFALALAFWGEGDEERSKQHYKRSALKMPSYTEAQSHGSLVGFFSQAFCPGGAEIRAGPI